MGLFSFLSKNKQDRTAHDSGHFSRAEDDALGERARSKRASNAGAPDRRGGKRATDPVLPEKKRARRRLVGSIALALAAAVGLPMLLDSEPRPLAGDIAIQIPSKEKAAPLPVPSSPVAAADTVDKGEEIVEAPKQVAAAAPAVAEVRAVPAKPEPAKAEHPKAAHPKAETPKAEPSKPEPKALAKAEPKPEAKPKLAEKSAPKADKPEEKPRAQTPEEAARALAILEGKQAEKAEKAHEASGGKFVLQVAALGSQEKAAELQAKLREAGINSFTQKLSKPSGELIRVKIGPFSKEEAEKVRARLGKLGLSGTMVPA